MSMPAIGRHGALGSAVGLAGESATRHALPRGFGALLGQAGQPAQQRSRRAGPDPPAWPRGRSCRRPGRRRGLRRRRWRSSRGSARCRSPASARMRRVASRPSMRGICMSIRIRSEACAGPGVPRACKPSSATSTWRPTACSNSIATCWLTGLSSASSNRAPRMRWRSADGRILLERRSRVQPARPCRLAKPGGEPEGAAAPGLLCTPTCRPSAGQALRDGQPQAGAAEAAGGRGVGLLEGLEEAGAACRRRCRCRCRCTSKRSVAVVVLARRPARRAARRGRVR